MTIYTETFGLSVPADQAATASAIGRALDPDVGGADSFHIDPGGETISMTTRCTPEFKVRAVGLLANPVALHAVVQADYARRWPDLTPPTPAECEAFCAVAKIAGA